jgi:hypothetical protein
MSHFVFEKGLDLLLVIGPRFGMMQAQVFSQRSWNGAAHLGHRVSIEVSSIRGKMFPGRSCL